MFCDFMSSQSKKDFWLYKHFLKKRPELFVHIHRQHLNDISRILPLCLSFYFLGIAILATNSSLQPARTNFMHVLHTPQILGRIIRIFWQEGIYRRAALG